MGPGPWPLGFPAHPSQAQRFERRNPRRMLLEAPHAARASIVTAIPSGAHGSLPRTKRCNITVIYCSAESAVEKPYDDDGDGDDL